MFADPVLWRNNNWSSERKEKCIANFLVTLPHVEPTVIRFDDSVPLVALEVSEAYWFFTVLLHYPKVMWLMPHLFPETWATSFLGGGSRLPLPCPARMHTHTHTHTHFPNKHSYPTHSPLRKLNYLSLGSFNSPSQEEKKD